MSNTIEKPFTTVTTAIDSNDLHRFIDGVQTAFVKRSTLNVNLPNGNVAGFVMEYAHFPAERKFNIYFAHHLLIVTY